MKVAKRIEGLFADRCREFKEEYKLNFGVYYTPAENLCYTAMNKFKEKYGIIPNVSDREYFTNSMHVPVWHDVDPFKKIDIEPELTGYSSAGCITYVELPSTTMNNLEALETIVNYAMDKDIPYFAVNVPVDQCECGYTGEILIDKELEWYCPNCGNKDKNEMQVMRRTCGYIGANMWGKGRTAEISERVLHL
jgi:ribonucleoside-triphosphate reductase